MFTEPLRGDSELHSNQVRPSPAVPRLRGQRMNCYECAQSGRTSEAVAVCRLCGAAVCADHVRTETVQLREAAQPGKVMHDEPARRLTCPVCRAAEESP